MENFCINLTVAYLERQVRARENPHGGHLYQQPEPETAIR